MAGLLAVVFSALASSPAFANEKGPVLAIGGSTSGSTGGLLNNPRGSAVNLTTGNIYVADSFNNRISEFTSGGIFIRAWGANVVSGTAPVTPNNSNEVQAVAVNAAAGAFRLTFEGQSTGATGTGDVAESSVIVSNVVTSTGTFIAGETISGTGIPAGTTILAVGVGTLTLSQQATATNTGVSLTSDLPFNASAGIVQSALNALSTISAGGGAVSVSGGPGNVGGTTPYVVTFSGGPLAGKNVAQMTGASVGLSGGSGTGANAATVTTTNSGETGFEICDVATGNTAAQCQAGATATTTGGGMNFPQAVAVDQTDGSVYVTDQNNRRIEKFTANGAFVWAAGWDVVSTGPDNDTVGTANQFEMCVAAKGDVCKIAASAGTNAGQFSAAQGNLGVNPNNGQVTVADPSNRRLQRFSSAGAFLLAAGWDVIPTGQTGDAGVQLESCPASSAQVTGGCRNGQTSSGGANLGQFSNNQPSRVAVDSGGSVYAVESSGNNRVQKFNPSLTSASKFAEPILAGSPAPVEVAVNQKDDHVFVSKPCTATTCPEAAVSSEQRIKEFDNAGNFIGTDDANVGFTTLVVNGLGVDASGNPLVSSTLGGHRIYVLGKAVPPVAVMTGVSSITGNSATFEGEINPTGLPVSYHFEDSTDGVNWTKLPEVNSGFSDSSLHPVQQTAPELVGSQQYHVRLVANKHFLLGTRIAASATSVEQPFSTPGEKPAISGEQVSERTAESAILEAEVNSENESTTYHFEYTDKADFEANGYANATEVPVPGREIEAGNVPVGIAEQIIGLEPDTAYVFRAVANNFTGTTNGADRNFVTFPDQSVQGGCSNEEVRKAQGSTYLPDCRAFELVNTPDKGNQNAATELKMGTPPITADGEEMVWNVLGGAPEANVGTGNFLAERTSNGWQSKSIIPPAEEQANNAEFGGYLLEATTPDLSAFVFKTPRTPLSRGHTIVRFDAGQHETTLRDYPEVEEYPEQAIDLTDDGSHVLSVNTDTPAQLEDYGDGSPETISVMPDGSENECGLGWPNEKDGAALEGHSFVGTGNFPHEGVSALWLPGYHLIDTTSASRVYFQAKPNADELGGPLSCANRPYALYERNREAPEETILIDEGPGIFEGAPHLARVTPDGRTAYFVTSSTLDPADSNSENDIYRWDEETEESTCLTCVVAEPKLRFKEGGPASIRISDDFSHIYFESLGELVPGKGTPGDFNLYVLSGGTIKFVADPNSGGFTRGVLEQARLSQDGNVLLFKPENPGAGQHFKLTSDELAPLCKSALGAFEGCEELFRYDDRDESLVCVSCQKGDVTTNSVGMSGSVDLGGGPYEMSGDGSTIAFETAEKLVPRDVNGSADIYEWRDSVVRLLTNGVTTYQTGVAVPEVMAIDETGHNVFIALDSPGLTGFEQDGLLNLYDARVGGGFIPPAPQERCNEESCQGQLQPAPSIDRSASGSYVGPGNPPRQRPCAHHKVRRHGRCVVKPHKNHRHGKSRVRRAANNRGGVK